MASGQPGKPPPVRTLLILRHATAGISPDGVDFNRPLSAAGVQESQAVGRFLRTSGIAVEGVVASSAVRALQTAEEVVRAAGLRTPPQAAQALYNAPGETLLGWIQQSRMEVRNLMVVAHMPGVGDLTSLLICRSAEVAMSFQPGSLACITVEAYGWEGLSFGQGVLKWLLPVGLMAPPK